MKLPYWWWQQTVVTERGIYRPVPWAQLALLAGLALCVLLVAWSLGKLPSSAGLLSTGIMVLIGLVSFIVSYSTHGLLGKALLEIHGGVLRCPLPAEARDFPGFVSNRVLMPFLNEAAYAVMEGVAEPEAIDTIAKLGFAHPLGPLALADLIGLDTCVAIMEVLHAGLGDPKYAPCPLLRQYVAAGRLGRKSGRGFYEYA